MDLPVAEGQIVAKKYRVERVIGSGGMGVVAAAVNVDLDQPVAIKFLSPEASTQGEAAERFRREARAAAKIRSEHVVRVLDVGVFEQRLPFMVMELLEGNDLGQELERRGPLPLAEAVHHVVQAIDAIAEAHGIGIVHRDLKPSNLFLTRRGDGTTVIKVLDFGISKLIGAAQARDAVLTRTASIVGSPLYMSPEQMRSPRDVDPRTDVWSLGAILYELVSGALPFSGTSLPEICVSVLNDTPRPLSTRFPEIPEEFDQLISRCLVKDREQRFENVAALSAALVRFSPGDFAYAARAERVLLHPMAPSVELPTSATVLSATPSSRDQEASLAPNSTTQPEKLGSPTDAAWGNTQGSTSKRWRVPALITLLLAGAIAAVLVTRSPSNGDDTPRTSAELDPTLPVPKTQAALTEPAGVPADIPPAPSAAVARANSAEVVNTPAATSAPPPKAASTAKAHAAARVAPLPPAKPASPPAAPKATSGSSLSDFGGRR